MKKILALALVAMMIAAIVPTTFAVPAQEPIDRESMTRGREAMGLSSTQNAQTQTEITDFSSINQEYRTVNSTKGWMEDTPRGSYPMLEPEETLLNGYWVEKDRFALVDDWYTDGSTVYTGAFYINDGVEGGTLNEFMQGDIVWFNFDLYKSFDAGSQTLVPLDTENLAVEAYVWAGTMEQYMGDDPEQGITLRYAWMSGTGSLSCKIVTPEDNYVYMIVIVLKQPELQNMDFGGWLTPSYAYQENEFKNIEAGADMTVGKSVTTELGKNTDSSLVLAPFDQRNANNQVTKMMYEYTYGQRHKIELQGHQNYVAMFDSSDAVGIRIFFCDENMDVINSTYAGPAAVAGGYKNFAMAIMPVTTGTYYLVTCGFYMGDEGELEATIYNWNDQAVPLTNTDDTIDLNNLEDGTVGKETGSASQPYAWGYYWYDQYSLGELIILWPGTYTINGQNTNIYCDVYDGVHIILNNAAIGPVWAANTYAPVEIEAVGNASIDNSYFQFSVYNYEGDNAGIYFTGDSMEVTSSGNSQGAVMSANAPMHILTKTFAAYCEERAGYYPAAIWITGKNLPQLTFGSDAQFDGENRKCTMCYDGDGWFPYGYTVSVHDEVYRLHNQPNWYEMAYSFEVTTGGTVPDPSDSPAPTAKPTAGPTTAPTSAPHGGMLGDANEDGTVNTGDATMVLRHAAGIVTLDGQAYLNADINQDGTVNTGDATYILKVSAGMLPNPNN